MKSIVIATAMSLCVVSLAAVSSADILVMRDGRRVEGTVVAIASRTITFRHADGATRRYPTSEVYALEFLSAERLNPSAVRSHRLAARAGTELVVRTVETIDSRNSGADQIFSAIVEQDVASDAHVVIPAGSSAQLIIREIATGGAAGSPEMALDIQAITIDGRRYVVSTAAVTVVESDTGTGKNRRPAGTTGTGAALGTIIDASPGGGTGAAIGILVGTAGGAGAEILTRGHDVRVPAQTALRFRLEKTVTLQAER